MDITNDPRPEGTVERDALLDRAETERRTGLDLPVDAERAGELTLRAEQLVADTETQQWARVRISRRIVTEERQITVPVRREELVVEYLDGTEPQHDQTGDPAGGERRPVEEFVLREEVPRVEMDLVARERVQVFVETTRREVVLSEEVAREEVRVEGDNLGTAQLDGDGLEHLDRR